MEQEFWPKRKWWPTKGAEVGGGGGGKRGEGAQITHGKAMRRSATVSSQRSIDLSAASLLFGLSRPHVAEWGGGRRGGGVGGVALTDISRE